MTNLYTSDSFILKPFVYDYIGTYPFCEIILNVRDKAICCDLCNKWIHIRCNDLNDLDQEDLKLRDETW